MVDGREISSGENWKNKQTSSRMAGWYIETLVTMYCYGNVVLFTKNRL